MDTSAFSPKHSARRSPRRHVRMDISPARRLSRGSVSAAVAAVATASSSAAATDTAPHVTIHDLPDEVLLLIFARLSCRDVCNLFQTCRRFRDLGMSPYVQARISFSDLWPMPTTAPLFKRASTHGNLEAALKLGVASLYGEGVMSCVPTAAELLVTAEMQGAGGKPYTWLMYRPPWSSDTCSKACIFQTLLNRAVTPSVGSDAGPKEIRRDRLQRGRLLYCAAKTMTLTEAPNVEQTRDWFMQSLELGCGDAAMELINLSNRFPNSDIPTRAQLLQQAASSSSVDVQLALCLDYVTKRNSLLPEAMSQRQYVQQFVQRGCNQPKHRQRAPYYLDPDGKMRHILMDWLVEVTDLKSFARETLFLGGALVDRFLTECPVTRKTLQLVGIACMVIASRFNEEEVITIREASWLTDNTYNYEQIVRTIGQALYTARGEIRFCTSLDYIKLFIALSKFSASVEQYMYYIAEYALMAMNSASHPPAIIAAGVYFLTLSSCKFRDCWPTIMEEWTQLSIDDFAEVLPPLYARIFLTDPVRDHRGVQLASVRERYIQAVNQKGLDNMLTSKPPDWDEILRHITAKMTEERNQLKPNLHPRAVRQSASSRALRSITNMPHSDDPQEAKRSRRVPVSNMTYQSTL